MMISDKARETILLIQHRHKVDDDTIIGAALRSFAFVQANMQDLAVREELEDRVPEIVDIDKPGVTDVPYTEQAKMTIKERSKLRGKTKKDIFTLVEEKTN